MKNKDILLLTTSTILLLFAFSYIGVPLYQLFCQETGYGGTLSVENRHSNLVATYWKKKPTNLINHNQPIKLQFFSEVVPGMPLTFKPETLSIYSEPGIPTLNFYHSENLSNNEIVGISTYNVSPASTAKYIMKEECFCFNDQRWLPFETIELPLLLTIDPKIQLDPATRGIKTISISYTFHPSSINQKVITKQ